MALTKVSRGLLSTSIVDNGNATAITIDSSENVTFSGTVTADGLTVNGIASVSATNPKIQLFETDTTDLNTQIQNQAGDFIVSRLDDDAGSLTVHFSIDHSTGNVSIPSGDLDVTGTVTATDLTLSDGTNPTLTITDTTNTTTLFLEAANLSTTIGTSTNHPLKFDTNNTERARIDESGNLLVGKTSIGQANVGCELRTDRAVVTRDGGAALTLNRLTSDGSILELVKDGTTVGSIGNDSTALTIGSGSTGVKFGSSAIWATTGGSTNANGTKDLGASTVKWKDLYLSGNASMGSLSPGVVTISSGSYFIGNSANGYRFNNAANTSNLMVLKDDGTLLVGTTGAINSAKMSVNGNTTTFVIHPALDNNFDCGHPSYRWDDVRATNGTIQTSDRNEKQDIAELTDAEQRVAVAAKGLMRKFRWISSVQKKGDEARIHFGIIAQDLQAAFEAEGLDAGRYAMFISDTWTDEETGEERTRLGVRYSELLAFIIAAI